MVWEEARTALEEGQGSVRRSLQPFSTPVPGNPMPSSGLQGHETCVWYTEINAAKCSYLHTNKIIYITLFNYK